MSECHRTLLLERMAIGWNATPGTSGMMSPRITLEQGLRQRPSVFDPPHAIAIGPHPNARQSTTSLYIIGLDPFHPVHAYHRHRLSKLI